MDNLAGSGARVGEIVATKTNVRWRIFGLLLIMVAVNYVDRATLSVALPLISTEFSISATEQGLLLSSFFWAYCLMQIPAGFLVDRFLPRAVISGATLLWGGFEMLGAAATGWMFLLLTRIGLGIAESPIYPAGAKLCGLWLTRTERGRGAALLDGGAPLGAAFGSVIIGGLIAGLSSWRLSFVIAGVVTIGFGALAWYYLRNHPNEHPSTDSGERAYVADALRAEQGDLSTGGHDTLRSILSARSSWLLFGAWFCFNGQWYGFLTWIPSYLYKTQGVNIAGLGVLSFLVFFAGFVGDLVGGFVLDGLMRRSTRTAAVYRLVFGVSSAFATIAVFLVPYAGGGRSAVALLAATQFFLRWCGTYWTMPSILANPRSAGLLAGTMNFAGNISGIVVPIVVGVILDVTGSYFLALMFFALLGAGLFACSMGQSYRRSVGV